jgi:N-acetyl-anhydromuramyl-L-alanine amidase AmpD
MEIYPKAIQKPLTGHSSVGTFLQKNLVVLHITCGTTMDGAYETFKTSLTPHRVSAHFIIDRDGMVYQLLPLSDVAWHASEVNHRSIGIEHVAVPNLQMATEAQYAASSALVWWLCGELGIPCDRSHVQSHNEASPKDRHVLCCTGGLDPDKVVRDAFLQVQTTS